MGLSAAQNMAVEHLMRSAPDALLMRLNTILAAARIEEPVFAPVADMSKAEVEDRRLRDLILSPLQALTDPSLLPPFRPLLASPVYARLWRALPTLAPEEFKAALAASAGLRPSDPPPPELTPLYLAAGAALAAGAGPMPAQERAHLVKLLRLAPTLGQAGRKVAAWTRNLNSENAALVRLAYKDATGDEEECGPLFIAALQGRLDAPSQVLRLISAVMDRPSDRYLASSEMASFGERLLDDADAQLKAVRQFDPLRGREGGAGAAAALHAAHTTLREFEIWLALSKESPWGVRILTLKQALAQIAEVRIREAEPAVAAALPLVALRVMGAIAPRPGPKIDGDPVELLVRRAEGLLAFLEGCRATAAAAGFDSLRNKVMESLEMRLDLYVKDVVERLHQEEPNQPDRLRAHLDVAADFFGLIRGPEAAQIVRRRAAAA